MKTNLNFNFLKNYLSDWNQQWRLKTFPQLLINFFHFLSYIHPKLPVVLSLRYFATPLYKKQSPFLGDRHDYFHFKNQKLFFRVVGNSAKKILFVHGWQRDGGDFKTMMNNFKSLNFESHSFDLPAHGRSYGKRTNAFECAQALKEYMKRHGPFEVLIGHSFGGFTLALLTSLFKELKPTLLVTIGSPNQVKGIVDHFANKMHFSDTQKKVLYHFLEKKYQYPLDEMSLAHFTKMSGVRHLLIHDYEDKEVSIKEAQEIFELNQCYQLFTRQLGHNRILHSQLVFNTIVEFIN